MAVAPFAIMAIRARSIRPFLVAFALMVSWFADAIRAAGVEHWAVSAVYPVLQYSLIYRLYVPRWPAIWLMLGTAGLAAVAAVYGAYTGPDAVLRLAGGLVLTLLVVGRYRPGLLVYFGLGALAWAPLVVLAGDSPAFLYCFLAYQGCRVVGLGLISRAVWRDR